MFEQAYEIFQKTRKISASLLMWKLKIHYKEALELCCECWRQFHIDNIKFQKSLNLDEILADQDYKSPRATA